MTRRLHVDTVAFRSKSLISPLPLPRKPENRRKSRCIRFLCKWPVFTWQILNVGPERVAFCLAAASSPLGFGLLVGQFPSAVLRAGDDLQDSSASLTAIVSICVCCAHNVSINLFASFKVISHVATFSRKISSQNEPMRPRAISRVSRSRLSFSSGAYLAVNLPTTNERDTATAKKPGNRRSS